MLELFLLITLCCFSNCLLKLLSFSYFYFSSNYFLPFSWCWAFVSNCILLSFEVDKLSHSPAKKFLELVSNASLRYLFVCESVQHNICFWFQTWYRKHLLGLSCEWGLLKLLLLSGSNFSVIFNANTILWHRSWNDANLNQCWIGFG